MKFDLLYCALVCCVGSFFSACSVTSEKINYGHDACTFCKMTIVDKIHGAELVTQKGKVFKFDAIECLLNYAKDFEKTEVAFYLSNTYDAPEELNDVTHCIFLQSKAIPSPMGAFLTAFKDEKKANMIKADKTGQLLYWEDLKTLTDSQRLNEVMP